MFPLVKVWKAMVLFQSAYTLLLEISVSYNSTLQENILSLQSAGSQKQNSDGSQVLAIN